MIEASSQQSGWSVKSGSTARLQVSYCCATAWLLLSHRLNRAFPRGDKMKDTNRKIRSFPSKFHNIHHFPSKPTKNWDTWSTLQIVGKPAIRY